MKDMKENKIYSPYERTRNFIVYGIIGTLYTVGIILSVTRCNPEALGDRDGYYENMLTNNIEVKVK